LKHSHYDAVVIGAGQSGGPLSSALARSGRRTALVEREHVGGTCVNTGCTPTKTMIASARVAHVVAGAARYGVNVADFDVDLEVVRQRQRDIVRDFNASSTRQVLETEGLDLLMGEAVFSGEKQIDVAMNDGDSLRITADEVFINTGSRPATPEIPGLLESPCLNSTTIMELARAPEHLLVLGGGYVGLEFAQMFRRFGSEVTVLQRGKQLLSNEDADVADAVRETLEDEGITVHLDSAVVEVRSEGPGRMCLVARNGHEPFQVFGSHVLVAAGRQPNTDMLDVERAGLCLTERGHIPVNERLETSIPGIWAMGEVTGAPAFTHISYDDFRILRANLLDGGSQTTTGRMLPYAVFIDPELGRIGLTEREARKQGYDVRVAKMPFGWIARAIEMDETRGLIKVVVDARTDRILGSAVFGASGGELMAVLQVAMMGDLPYTALQSGIFAHPTLAESLNNVFNNFEG
jgi:pyruvate/2-oxoglutarate dehydrogenase complex dihydrolipoamide dehydrogenase (E3) component